MERGGSRLRFAEIALQHPWAAEQELAHLADRQSFAVGTADTAFAPRNGDAARSRAGHLARLDRHEEAGADLRHAKGLASDEIETCLEVGLARLRKAVGANPDDS